MGLPSVCEVVQGARLRVTGEVRQVELGGTVKVLESEMGAMGRGRAGMDNYSSPQNLGGNSYVKIVTMFA